jgi:outer membrane protein TolC
MSDRRHVPAALGAVVGLVLLAGGRSRATAQDGPVLELSVSDAVRTAIERSPDLAAARLEAEIFEADALEERGLYDPLLSVMVGREEVYGRDLSAGGILFDYKTDDVIGEALYLQLLPTGQTLEFGALSKVTDASRDGQQLVEAHVGGLLRQPLLRGVSPRANLGRARAAEHEAVAAAWNQRALAEQLALLVEQTCWDLSLARAQSAVLDDGMALARELLEAATERVASGASPHGEIVAAESEIALRAQRHAEVRAEIELAQNLLAGHLGLLDGGQEAPELRITDPFVPEGVAESADSCVATALQRRPDLEGARELGRRAAVEIHRTRHALLPRVDLWVESSVVGYGADAGEAWDDLDGDHWRFAAGVAIEQPLRDRENRADHRRETARSRQAEALVRAIERRAATEVRAAFALSERARDTATTASVAAKLDEEKLRIEVERFAANRASAFQVARAQRDLVARRLDEARAIADQRKAVAELFRAQGRLLERHGARSEP